MESSNFSSAMSMTLWVTQKNQHLGNQKGMTNNDNRLFALLSVPLVLLCVSVYMLLPEYILLSQNFMPFPTYLFGLPTFIIHLVRIWNVLSHLYPSTVSIKGKTSNSCYHLVLKQNKTSSGFIPWSLPQEFMNPLYQFRYLRQVL